MFLWYFYGTFNQPPPVFMLFSSSKVQADLFSFTITISCTKYNFHQYNHHDDDDITVEDDSFDFKHGNLNLFLIIFVNLLLSKEISLTHLNNVGIVSC